MTDRSAGSPAFPRTALPAGARTTWHSAADGAALRTLHWRVPSEAQRRVLFLGGKRDFIERHCEAYHRILAHGCALAAADWRDQGLSARGWSPSADLFDSMEADLHHILSWSEDMLGGPVTIVAHSMGAHMALRLLGGSADARRRVDRLVLSGPLLGLGGRGSFAAALLARLAVLRGRGDGHPPGQPPYGPEYRSDRRRLRLTGDRQRFDDAFSFIEENPALAAGGATWGWVDGAYRSMRALWASNALAKVDIPALLLLGTEERIVDPHAARRAATRLPQGRLVTIKDGHHELFLDTDAVQDRVWQAIWSFLA